LADQAIRKTAVVILSFELRHSGPIEVVDGDTVRLQGMVYRGFDISERGDKARCDYSSFDAALDSTPGAPTNEIVLRSSLR
jgi:hypothetical protein